MSFSPFKVGGYAYGEVLTSTQMNQANDDLPFALDGRDGGSYTPTDDLDLQTPATKNVVLNGCTFPSASSGGGVTCTGNVQATGNLVCSAVTTTNIIATGDLTIGSSSGDTVDIVSSITTHGPFECYERVRAVKGVQPGQDNGATGTYSWASYDIIYIEPGHAVTGGSTWQISGIPSLSASGSRSEIMSFRHLGTGSSVAVKDHTGATIATIGPLSSGNLIQVDVIYAVATTSYKVIAHVYMP